MYQNSKYARVAQVSKKNMIANIPQILNMSEF